MLTSVALLEGAGISRATLNNYIAVGLLPRPEVRRQAAVPGEAPTTLGYFPDWALDRIQQIQELKRAGVSMEDIKRQLVDAAEPVKVKPVHTAQFPLAEAAPSPAAAARPTPIPSFQEKRTPQALLSSRSESVRVSVDNIPYPAYMVNFEFQLIWLNALAQKEFFTDNLIPERANDRSIVPTLLEWAEALAPAGAGQLVQRPFGAHEKSLVARYLQPESGQPGRCTAAVADGLL